MKKINIEKITEPEVIFEAKTHTGVDYRVKQTYKIDDFEIDLYFNCVKLKDGSVIVSDYDTEKNCSLNSKAEAELVEYYGDTSKAFEAYELLTLEADLEALEAVEKQ